MNAKQSRTKHRIESWAPGPKARVSASTRRAALRKFSRAFQRPERASRLIGPAPKCTIWSNPPAISRFLRKWIMVF